MQHLLQDFWSVSDHFETLCIKGLTNPNSSIRQKENQILLSVVVYGNISAVYTLNCYQERKDLI